MGPKIGRFHELSEVEIDADKTDAINVESAGAVMDSDTAITADTIDEQTATLGVTIETVLVKDGLVDGRNISVDGVVVDLNETHRSSNGSDHTFIDQDVTNGSSPTFDGGNITGIPKSGVDITVGGTPVIDNLEELMFNTGSVGVFNLTDGVITDEGATKFQIAAGAGLLRLTGTTSSPLISMEWNQTDILYSSLVSGKTYYIYVENVAGTPTVQFTDTASNIDHIKDIDLGFIWYNAENLIFNAPTALYDLPDRQHEAMIASFGYTHVSGAAISEPANLKLGLTASNWYYGYIPLPLGALDTNVADTFTYFHRTASVWTEVTGQTSIDTTNYNDTSSGLTALTVNRYGVHWVFLNSNGGLYVVYGTGDYTIALAEAASIPGTLPPQFDKFCKVVGKVIVQKGAASLYSLESPFVETFISGVATVHNNMGGLNDGDYKHLTATEKTLFDTIESGADVTDIDNVGSSINGATGKTTPVDADKLGLIDSAASNVLKTLTWVNVKATLNTYFDTLYNLYSHPNHTGDVTSVNDGPTTIVSDSVTYDKMQDTTTDKLLGRSTAGTGIIEEISCTPAARALLDDIDAATQRATLGLGTLAIQNSVSDDDFAGTDLKVINGGTGSSSFTTGGILLGNGSGNLGVMAVLAAGSLVVGDGVGDPIVLVKGTGLQYLRVNSGATALEYATIPNSMANIWLAAAAADLPQTDFTLTGTVTMTNASTAVTGSGTAFDTEMKIGDYIKLDADGSAFWAKISAIASAVALTIDANYGGTGGSSAGSGSGRPCGYSYILGKGESIGYGQLELDDTAKERVGWRIPLPDVPTTMSLKLYWKQASVGTGNVVFELGIKGVNEGENITTLLMPTLSDTIIDAAGNNVTHLTIELDGSVVSNATNDEMGIFLLEVNAPHASHTLVGDVNVFGILAEYTKV